MCVRFPKSGVDVNSGKQKRWRCSGIKAFVGISRMQRTVKKMLRNSSVVTVY